MAFFENIGRFFFEKTRVWFFFLCLFLPFFIVFFLLLPRFVSLRETEEKFDSCALRSRSALEKRAEKEFFLSRYSKAEPFFIDQHLEAPHLMQETANELHQIYDHPACKNRSFVAKRIAFLEGTENRLLFAEESVRSSRHIVETEERLVHPIEVEQQDVERLLCLIEGVNVGSFQPKTTSPQLLIHQFSLTKKTASSFELNLSLIKREFHYDNEEKN